MQGTAGPLRLKLMVPNLRSNTLPVQGTTDSQRLELMVRYRFVSFSEPVGERFVLPNGPVAEPLPLLNGPVSKVFFTRKKCL